MRITSLLHLKPSRWLRHAGRYLGGWWYMLHLGAIALVMAMSPSTYRRDSGRTVARHLYSSTWQVLPWFTLLAALVSLVLIRIVVVTALSYGLSRYALEMVVRVLVLELIPLGAALFVALRAGLAFSGLQPLSVADARQAYRRVRRELVAEVVANVFSVLSLATVNSVIVLVLAYLSVYGLSPWGLDDYTRTVGRVFDPAVTTGFGLKTLLFGLAVAVIPTAAALDLQRRGGQRSSTVQPGAVRLLFVLLLIEAASLAVKYI